MPSSIQLATSSAPTTRSCSSGISIYISFLMVICNTYLFKNVLTINFIKFLLSIHSFLNERAFIWLKRRKSRSEEHTSELQSRGQLVCRLLLEKKKKMIG